MKTALLTTALFPPVQYVSKFLHFDTIFIEKHENYQKQSYRNRYVILSSNGPLSLSVPIERAETEKIKISDVRIAYHTPWQKTHKKAIISAYNNSPFFEYYFDELSVFFEKKYVFLLDYNDEVLRKIFQLIFLKKEILFTREFISTPTIECDDYRSTIHPKGNNNISDKLFFPSPYIQVFSEKFGFVSNLSILDLLFNTGPDALNILIGEQ